MPHTITEIIRAGLTFEKQRLEMASYNLAIANQAIPHSDANSKLVGNTSVNFASKIKGLSASLSQTPIAFKEVLDPSHPMADSRGMVRYPDIDPVHEMATLSTATRAYEANVRAFNTMHQMAGKALEIGGRR